MKYLSMLFGMIIFFTACKKAINEELMQSNKASFSGNIAANIQPVPAYRWVKMTVPPFTATHTFKPEAPNITTTVGSDFYCVAGGTNALNVWYKFNSQTKQWGPAQNTAPVYYISGDAILSQYIFSYQDKMYTGMGFDADVPALYSNGFNSLVPVAGPVSPLAFFPGVPSESFTAFVIGTKGYIMGGYSSVANDAVNQLWEYDFATNVWTNKGGSPLGKRALATVIVANGKAYMGMGYDYITLNGQKIKQYKNDWVEYIPGSSVHAIKTDFPGTKRADAKGFVIDGNIYAGFGYNSSGGFNDFWKYNISTNTWAQQASYPGSAVTNSYNTNGFSTGSEGYIVKGDMAEFYRFTNAAF